MVNLVQLANLKAQVQVLRKKSIPFFKAGMTIYIVFRKVRGQKHQYMFGGVVLGHYKKRSWDAAVLVRNVMSLFGLEQKFALYSPTVQKVYWVPFTFRPGHQSKGYFLRKKAAPRCRVAFTAVTRSESFVYNYEKGFE